MTAWRVYVIVDNALFAPFFVVVGVEIIGEVQKPLDGWATAEYGRLAYNYLVVVAVDVHVIFYVRVHVEAVVGRYINVIC